MKILLEKNNQDCEICCNMCGHQISKNGFGYFEDYLSVTKTWGYGTPIDGETHSFNLCFKCYSDMIDQFMIPPRVLADKHEIEIAQ